MKIGLCWIKLIWKFIHWNQFVIGIMELRSIELKVPSWFRVDWIYTSFGFLTSFRLAIGFFGLIFNWIWVAIEFDIDWVLVHVRKEKFPAYRRFKLQLRGDDDDSRSNPFLKKRKLWESSSNNTRPVALFNWTYYKIKS